MARVEDDGRRERTLPTLATVGILCPAKTSPQLEAALSVWRRGRALAEEGRADASVDLPDGTALEERRLLRSDVRSGVVSFVTMLLV